MEPIVKPWDSPGLPPRFTWQERCANHSGECAYRDDDPARCPWCHCPWDFLERAGHGACLRTQRESARDRARRPERYRHGPNSPRVVS